MNSAPPARIGPLLEAAARDVYNVVHPRTRRIDTFLVSFPKCGRTWLELMLAHGFVHLHGLDPSLLSRDLQKTRARAGRGPVIYTTHDWSEVVAEVTGTVSPHLLFSYPFRMRYWGRRVLMLIRDPRDTIVSNYYQSTQRALHPLPFNDIDSYVLDPLYGFPRLVRFYKVWNLNRRFVSPFMLVRYEELRRDGGATLQSIFEFVGLTGATPQTVRSIFEACRFDRVRAMEAAGEADLLLFSGPDASKARRAKIGGYADELKPETIERLNRWIDEIPELFAYPV